MVFIYLAFIIVFVLLGWYVNHRVKRKQRLYLTSEPVEVPKEEETPVQSLREDSFAALGFDDMLTESVRVEPAHTIPQVNFNHLMTLHVLALPEKHFMGYELLQALLTVGLRFGEMNIFHRYAYQNATTVPYEKKILFSLASITEPGTFDLNTIGGFSCQGLSLFMSISQVENPESIFDLMLDTAQQLADELGGVVVDETRQTFSEETLDKYKGRIKHHTVVNKE